MEERTELKQQALWKNGASKGGKIRAQILPPEKRKEIAKLAANTRWKVEQAQDKSATPIASFPGKLEIGDLVIPCAVLDNGVRVLSERGVTKALGGKRGGSHWQRQATRNEDGYLPVFMSANNLLPFMSPSLKVALSKPILYKSRSGQIGYGVLATLIPEICDVWLKARRAEKLLPNQSHIAKKAEVLLAGLAHVGIIALVDAVTGYEKYRPRYELVRILEAYISDSLLPWTKRFPDEYYKELFRLRGWSYSPPQPRRPRLIGKLTNQLIYEKLPQGVLKELRTKNPVVKDGRRAHKHFQYLTEDIGNPHLEKQLTAVTILMKVSSTWGKFCRLFNKAFPNGGIQSEWELGGEDD